MICACLSLGVIDLQDLYNLHDLYNLQDLYDLPEWDVCDLYDMYTGNGVCAICMIRIFLSVGLHDLQDLHDLRNFCMVWRICKIWILQTCMHHV